MKLSTRQPRHSLHWNKLSSSPGPSLHIVKDEGTGDSDAATNLAKQHGVIATVKPKYGFIKFGRNQRDRELFHANHGAKSLGMSIQNLPGVFTAEDKVRFDAKPSKKAERSCRVSGASCTP